MRAEGLQGRVAIVTGASRGIGAATARALALAGARVVLAAPESESVDLTAVQRTIGAAALVIPTDITVAMEVQHLVQETQRQAGRLDLLVNNAGLGYGGAFATMSADQLQRLLAVNVAGTLRMTQAVLPALLTQRSGHIVFLSSAAAELPVPGVAAYAASKAALWMLARTLRLELAPHGIGVTVVLPALVQTAMVAAPLDALRRKQRVGLLMTLLSRAVAKPEAVAAQIVQAVQRRRGEVYVGGLPTRLLVLLGRLAPRLLETILAHVDQATLLALTAQMGK